MFCISKINSGCNKRRRNHRVCWMKTRHNNHSVCWISVSLSSLQVGLNDDIVAGWFQCSNLRLILMFVFVFTTLG